MHYAENPITKIFRLHNHRGVRIFRPDRVLVCFGLSGLSETVIRRPVAHLGLLWFINGLQV